MNCFIISWLASWVVSRYGGFSRVERGWKSGAREGIWSGSFVSAWSIVWIAVLVTCMNWTWVSRSVRIVAILLLAVVRRVVSFWISWVRSWSFSPRVVMVFRSSVLVSLCFWISWFLSSIWKLWASLRLR